MQLYGGKTKQGKAPDRGSFPLDHHSECKSEVEAFLRCLQESSSEHVRCKRLSKAYLQCRMDKELMARENLDDLGLGSRESDATISRDSSEGEKEADGFVAGTHLRRARPGGIFGIGNLFKSSSNRGDSGEGASDG
eukprot:g2366.t1